MNTRKTVLLVAFAFGAMMVWGTKASAQPAINVCAKQMCAEMRNCTTQVENEGIVQRPTGDNAATNATAKAPAKKAESAQGVPTSTCNQMALWNYQSCIGLDKAPGGDKKPGATIKTKSSKTNKAVTTPNNK
jgi:hypothetical protein